VFYPVFFYSCTPRSWTLSKNLTPCNRGFLENFVQISCFYAVWVMVAAFTKPALKSSPSRHIIILCKHRSHKPFLPLKISDLRFVRIFHLTYTLCSSEPPRFDHPTTIGWRARGAVVDWGTMLQAGRSPNWVPDEVDFFNLPNPFSRTMALVSTQPLT
jgi:hypothetical protein